VALFLFFIAEMGCAGWDIPTCQKIVDSWMGTHIDNAITQLGPPTGEKQLNNGGTAMSWQTVWGRRGTTFTQTLILISDSNGIIRSGSYPGCTL
jgi:hypothetical protein